MARSTQHCETPLHHCSFKKFTEETVLTTKLSDQTNFSSREKKLQHCYMASSNRKCCRNEAIGRRDKQLPKFFVGQTSPPLTDNFRPLLLPFSSSSPLLCSRLADEDGSVKTNQAWSIKGDVKIHMYFNRSFCQ